MCSANIPVPVMDLSVRLFKANAIKFGSFSTQIGAVTPVYFDLRVIVSYPSLMKELADLLSDRVNSLFKEYQKIDPKLTKVLLCGIPYAAVPFTSLISVKTNLPMIMKRKEAKNYGTNNIIEGVWDPGDICILIDDVIMFGNSVVETVEALNNAGLKCSQVVVILDRQQGAKEKLDKKGIKVHALLTLNEIMESLLESKCVTADTCAMVSDYLEVNQVSDVSKYYSCSS